MTAVPSTSPLSIDIPAPRVPIGYPVVAASATIRALECGIGDDILVCLHGAGSRADRFEQNLSGLAARGYHVFALDFPGHGFAAKPGEFEYGVRFFADVVQDFLHQLDHPVVFVGTSLGGHVAAMVACREPDRVRAAVLVGAVGLVPFELGVTPPLGKAGAEADPRQARIPRARPRPRHRPMGGARDAHQLVAGCDGRLGAVEHVRR